MQLITLNKNHICDIVIITIFYSPKNVTIYSRKYSIIEFIGTTASYLHNALKNDMVNQHSQILKINDRKE